MKIAVIKGSGVIAPYIMQDYAEAFKEQGHECITVEIESSFDEVTLQKIVNFNPEFVVAYGYVGVLRTREDRFLLRELAIPVVCLHYDNPFFGLDDKKEMEFKNYSDYYHHFIWDELYLNLFLEKGFKYCYKIMLATNPKRFFPEPKTSSTEGMISFIGSIARGESTQEENLEDLFINFIMSQKIKNLEVPMMELCYEAFKIKEFQPISLLYQKNSEAFWKQIYYPLHRKGSAEYRKHIINSLEGIDIHVYGAKESFNSNIISKPSIPYSQLSRVYQNYSLNLNISSLQLETSINNRVFDVFASKAFVLSDYKKDMRAAFPDFWEEISYMNLEDLVVKADYYLTHPKEKEELTEQLYQEVLEKHTYAHRAEQIVQTISEKLPIKGMKSTAPAFHSNKYEQLTDFCPICESKEFTQLHTVNGHDDFVVNLHRCSACAAVFMNPQPTAEYLDWFYNELYYSEAHRKKMGWSADISEVSAASLRNYEVRMDFVESFTNQTVFPRGRLLDVGCSTGNFLLEARSRYWEVQGIEVSDVAAEQGRRDYQLDVISGVLNEETFEDSTFDVVTAWDVIEHISDPHFFIGNVKRVLKAGGLLALNTPNVSSTVSYHAGSGWRHLDPPLHVILYDHISLRVLLKIHGFEILKISSGSEYLGQLQLVARKLG
ncbi:glycosyltransferase family protein [Saccharibacillus kuerlensis]|uniref:Spore protein YkvP/CgeB glycosyl transferase-like domain-containing protein n=1 Tax=Saccharibacillus kuerlensis TaxID=459527 RepID=A0ABQ2KUG1_9BACL|nr:methyltransferase domain-containing protein [Saccharibacillus kuerlensis]GGN93168.1 hypothetical protein GCM10010969_06430 [Saccharibacillus kuerlensis]